MQIINAIEQFFSFLEAPFNLLVKFFEELVYVVKLLTGVLRNAATYFWFLPAAVTAALVTLLTIVVAYKIVGRS